jgi:hypothetical protein
MGALFETQAFYCSSPGGTTTAFTAVSGDSLVNRFFQAPGTASIIAFEREGATAGLFRVRSPLLYDNVKGIHIYSAANQTIFALPAMNVEQLQSQDTLIIEGTGGTEYEVVLLTRYYSNFAGSAQRLYSWGTIAPLIVHLYDVEVSTTIPSTPVAWTDFALSTTESLLKANIDHAVLGWTVNVECGGVALKGADTSNFRYGGPGITLSPFTPNYFMRVGEKTGLPAIPVINSANYGNTFVSIIDAASSGTVLVTLHLAELARNLT